MNAGTTLVLTIVLLVAAIIFGPLLCIWALNTLFGLAIGYTLKTWAAAALLASLIGASRSSK